MKQVKTKAGASLLMNDTETEVLYNGSWRQIQEDQEGELYFIGKVTAIYLSPLPASHEPETLKEDWAQLDKEVEELEKALWDEPTGTPPAAPEMRGEQFTPGEWAIMKNHPVFEGKTIILSKDNDNSNSFRDVHRMICEMTEIRGDSFTDNSEYMEANARLICKSKAMYAALKKLLFILECERTQTGVSLDIRYSTEYTEAKAILSSIENKD